MKAFTTTIRTSLVGLVAIATLAPVVAMAAPEGDARTVRVSYGDLNLASPKGVSALHARVIQAAREICGYDITVQDLTRAVPQRVCVKRVVATADVQVAAAIRGTDVGTSFALNEKPIRR